MIKKGVILVLLFSCLAEGGKKQSASAIFQKDLLIRFITPAPVRTLASF